MYTDAVADSALVTIAVNYGAAELVIDSGRASGLSPLSWFDGPDCSSGAIAALVAPVVVFLATEASDDHPDP